MRRPGWLLLIGLLAAAGLVTLYRSERALFYAVESRIERRAAGVARDLATGCGVLLLYTADGQPGEDLVTRKPVRICGTRATRGRHGDAIEFDGGRRSFVTFPTPWTNLAPSFSVAMWVWLDARSLDQEILFAHRPSPIGLKLDRGHLSMFVSSGEVLRAASYGFTNYDRFVHVAAVVDAAARRTRLYEDGELRAEVPYIPVDRPDHEIALGQSTPILIGDPLMGAVDDVVIWNRPLETDEVRRLAHAGRPALSVLAPRSARRLAQAELQLSALRRTLKLIDRFNPRIHMARMRRAPHPEVDLVLSKRDARFFSRGHMRSRRSGNLLDDAATARDIAILSDGRAIRGSLKLTGSASHYAASERRAYLLEPEDGQAVLGLRRVRLLPPEAAGWLDPLVETSVGRALGLRCVSNGLCRLRINGEFAGLYYYEDAETLGVLHGFGTRRVCGEATRKDWTRVASPGPPPVSRATLAEHYRRVQREARDLLRFDPAQPLSSREVRLRVAQRKDALAKWRVSEPTADDDPLAFAVSRLSPWDVLGTIPAPQFLAGDLDLGVPLPDGVRVAWESSDPAVLDAAGHVHAPTDGIPRVVTLTARIDAGGRTATNRLPFRVMPTVHKLPAYFLWIDRTLGRLARVPCAVDYRPAGANAPAIRWLAEQEDRAGISIRGNSTMRQPKQSFNLRLAAPHGLWGTTNVTKIRLVSPWRDPSFLHNRFFYSLFASFADAPGRRRDGLPVDWCEVFINGDYYGLFEASPPVRAEWLGLDPHDPDEHDPAVVYKAQRTTPSLQGPASYMERQIEPSRRHGHFPNPGIELHRFIEESTPEEFAADIERRLDIENLIDFHLLLDFSENYNGFPFDFAIHDILVRRAGGGPFFLVPYDFDNTYGFVRMHRYHSHVFRRLLRDVPGYRDRLEARWSELRGGPLDLARVQTDLRAWQEHLRGYVECEYEKWGTARGKDHAQRVDEFLGHIRRRVSELDAQFASP